MDFDADLQDRLQKSFDEIVRLKKENFEETCHRQQVEKEFLVVRKKVIFFITFHFSLYVSNHIWSRKPHNAMKYFSIAKSLAKHMFLPFGIHNM